MESQLSSQRSLESQKGSQKHQSMGDLITSPPPPKSIPKREACQGPEPSPFHLLVTEGSKREEDPAKWETRSR